MSLHINKSAVLSSHTQIGGHHLLVVTKLSNLSLLVRFVFTVRKVLAK
jgi:hypothetical protein